MNKLENLVPPLELCQQMPEGSFDDSALVWQASTTAIELEWIVVPRGQSEPIMWRLPAPTLAEILEALPTCIPGAKKHHFYLRLFDLRLNKAGMGVGYAHSASRGFVLAKEMYKCDANPATAALRLWLDINKEN